MSDDSGQHAQPHWQDAFTSPSWQLHELDEAVLAPPFEDFGLTDFRAPRDLPRPPDVDQILRGEYTGWIPVIREGESLEQVQERAQVQETFVTSEHVEEIVQIVEVVQQPQTVQHVEPTQQSTPSSPWLAVETFEYGHQALHEVSVPVQPTPVAQPIPVAQPESASVAPQPVVQHTSHAEPVQPAPQPIDQPTPDAQPAPVIVAPRPVAQLVQPDAFNDTFDTSSWNASDVTAEQPSPRPTQSIDATLVAEATGTADHSLELVIMRDEIQDLRNRLDSSQKLLEEMMHKLANLAELALRSRM